MARFVLAACCLLVATLPAFGQLYSQLNAAKVNNGLNITLGFQRAGDANGFPQDGGLTGPVHTCKLTTQDAFEANHTCATLVSTSDDAVVVTVKPKANMTFYNGMTPKTMSIRLCYSKFSSVLRGWRKAYDDIKLDRQCKTKAGDVAWPSDGSAVTHVFPIPEEQPEAIYFVRVLVKCADASGNMQWCAYSNSTMAASPSLFFVQGYDGVSNKMKIAVGVCSCIGPLILIFFFTKEVLLPKKTV